MFSVDKRLLAEIMRKNRASLATVPSWISDRDYRASVFHYGLPEYVRPFIDGYIGDEPTYSDIIAYFAKQLARPVRYFEIGVSVGKNFFQMLHHVEFAEMVGLDIEDINPVLAGFLTKREHVEWPTMEGSLRKAPSSVTEYEFSPHRKRVRYIAGDVFDDDMWRRLAGEKFNLVFSDAYHNGEALKREWNWISRLELMDETGCVMIWDDLDSPEMQQAFSAVAREMTARFSLAKENVGLARCRGWLGMREPPHTIGFAYKPPIFKVAPSS